jgi:hypothetical protein
VGQRACLLVEMMNKVKSRDSCECRENIDGRAAEDVEAGLP